MLYFLYEIPVQILFKIKAKITDRSLTVYVIFIHFIVYVYPVHCHKFSNNAILFEVLLSAMEGLKILQDIAVTFLDTLSFNINFGIKLRISKVLLEFLLLHYIYRKIYGELTSHHLFLPTYGHGTLLCRYFLSSFSNILEL